MVADSQLGVFIQKIVSLYTPLFRPVSLAELEEKVRPIVNLLVVPLKTAFQDTIEVDPTSAKHCGSDKLLCLRRLGLVNTHLFLCELKKIEICFYHTFLRNKGHIRTTPPMEFFPGYKMAIAFLLDTLREKDLPDTSLKSLLRSKTWKSLDSRYELIQNELVTPVETLHGINDFIFTKTKDVTESQRSELLRTQNQATRPAYSDRERLEQEFLWYDTKIVGTEGITYSSVAGVITTLMGVLTMHRNEPVRVLRFEHLVHHGSNFSYAVLVPSYSNIGNYSEWWVFPDFCNNVTGGGGSGYRYLTDFLGKARKVWENRIQYREIQMGLDQFLDYVKAPSTVRPRRELERDSDLLAQARGWILELVTSNVLRAQGYSTFHRIRNTSILGDLELDVLGVRYEQTGVRVLVAECSAGFSPKDTLRARVKVKILRNKWPRLLRYLNLTVPEVAEVEGWLVTGEKLPRSKTKLRTIIVLDSKRMEQLASKYGIPWMKVRRVFAEEPRVVRLLHARGLGDIAKFFPNGQP